MTTKNKCDWCDLEVEDQENSYFAYVAEQMGGKATDIMPKKILFEVHSVLTNETVEKGLCCSDCIGAWMCESPEDFELISIRKVKERI
jgi:hypothetical protein